MITLNDLERFLRPIKQKLYGIAGRALLTAVRNSNKTQRLQYKVYEDMVYDDVERLQEYGFETYPDASDENNEIVILNIGGNKDGGMVICVHNREERPKDLSSGEVCLYSKFKQKIWLKADGSMEILTDSKPITLKGSLINLKDTGGDPVMLETIINKFNNHTHLYSPGTGGATATAAPAAPNTFTAGQDSAANVKAKTG